MKIQSLGHVVLKVRDQERSEAFYHGLLGLPIASRMADPQMTFFSLGDHHDFAVAVIGEDADDTPTNAPGLAHVAFKIGNDHATLKDAKSYLETAGVGVSPRDHGVTQSLYMTDPDGNMVEVYVDISDAWKEDPDLVAQSIPLAI